MNALRTRSRPTASWTNACRAGLSTAAEWIHAFSFGPDIRIVDIGDPPVTSTVSLVTSASEPGSLLARSLAETARGLSLDSLFT
ncbi:MAG TPA: hypothetical protein VGG75_43145 [Trebonia sp.]|jgi:hypothetical protein